MEVAMTRRTLSSLFVYLVLGGVAAPVFAAGAHYRAEPAAVPSERTLVARTTVWKCGGTSCVAPAANSRPATVCALLVRKVGPLKSFTVAGQPLPAEELEKCNSNGS
jgi:hypothetical protein